MTTRPLLLGYLRADETASAAELASLTSSLASFASAEGFTLGTVYTERDCSTPAAFHALVDEVNRLEVRAVVVPNLEHLGGFDVVSTMRNHLEQHTTARVVAVQPAP
ncbi:hypothetical protein OG394_24125 [Kribbella sp. NBC_01245]|uniref:hypothetical protein n=1 Tax=Kribbella sp. NBC_01245 TaxID=2903578 RepID=UPI002E2B8AD1|nr:hypothetical protein [Kribbella sp. NBC_01245]